MNLNGRQIYGVDFSGSDEAYKKIWITEATISDDRLEVVSSSPARELPGNPRRLNDVLRKLQKFIEDRPNAVFGLDFPFSLPLPIANASSWVEFVRNFPQRFSSAEEFYLACKVAGGELDGEGVEYKRLTETESDAPLCSYNLWMHKQTYYGIKRLLYPFVTENTARVLPMQPAEHSKPWIMEICPSSTLRLLGLRRDRYKGSEADRARGREEILEDLSEHDIELHNSVSGVLLGDEEGDVLDSVIGAYAVYRTFKKGRSQIIDEPLDDPYSVEGYIFE